MNLVKQYEAIYRADGHFEKNTRVWRMGRIFFSLRWLKMPISGSQRFICFIKLCGDRFAVRAMTFIGVGTPYLMNLMNLYEVKIFKRFFENVALVVDEFMNLKSMVAS